MKCKTCKYYSGSVCRRYPPQVMIDPQGYFRERWPEMLENDWCGEYAPQGEQKQSTSKPSGWARFS